MLTCPHSNKTLQPGPPKLSFSKPQTNKTASFCRTWLTSATPDLCGRIFSFGMIPLSSATNGTSGACSPEATHVFKSSMSVIIRLYQQLAPIKESDSLQNVDMGRFMPEIRLGHRRGGQHVVSRVAPAGPSAGDSVPQGAATALQPQSVWGPKARRAWPGPEEAQYGPRRPLGGLTQPVCAQGLQEGLVSFLCQNHFPL